jgi:hypothetical protein
LHNEELPFLFVLLTGYYCSDQLQEVRARRTYGEEEECICGKCEELRLPGGLGVAVGIEIKWYLRKWDG